MSIPITESSSASTRSVGLSDVIRVLLRGAPFAVLAAIVAAIFAVAITNTLPPVYQASVALLASRPPSSFGTLDIITPPTVDPRVYQRVLFDGPVIHDALLRLDGQDRSETQMVAFKRKVGVSVENQDISAVIKIDVTDSDPQRAASYANAIADGLIEWDRNRARLLVDNSISALERAITEIDSEISSIVSSGDTVDSQRQQALAATLREQRVRELEAARARGASAVMVGLLETLNRAAPPVEAIGPRLVFNTFVALVLGVLLAYGAQLVYWSISNEVGSRDRLADLTGLPVLAVFSRRRGSAKPMSADAVSYFRANLMRGARKGSQLVVGLTTPSDFADKSDVAIALAESLALSGYRALVLDADLRQKGPGLGLGFGRTGSSGLEAFLRDPDLPLKTFSVNVEHHVAYEVIPSGSAIRQANELLEYGFERFIARIQNAYDVIIVDLPPVLAYADALVVAPACNGIVLCTDVKRRAESVVQSAKLLEDSGSIVLGTVLTGVPRQGGRNANRDRHSPQPSPRRDRTGRETGSDAPSPRAVARVKQRRP